MKEQCIFFYQQGAAYTATDQIFQAANKMLQNNEKGLIEEKLDDYLKAGNTICDVNLYEGWRENVAGESLFAMYHSQIIPYLTRHPMYYKDEINRLNLKEVIYASDQSYCDFIEKYYHRKAIMVPLPGIQASHCWQWKERTDTVFFPGTYLNPDTIQEQMEKIVPTVFEPILKQVIKRVVNSTTLTIEDALRQEIEEQMGIASDELILDFLFQYGYYIEEFINRFQRKRILRYLLKHQVSVTVCGLHWDVFQEELSEEEQVYLTILSEGMSLQTAAVYMGRIKVVLNIVSGHKNGIHERTATALINGAVCFTEKNPYTEKEAIIHPNLNLYEYTKLSQLVIQIKKKMREKASEEYNKICDLSVPEFINRIFNGRRCCELKTNLSVSKTSYQEFESCLVTWEENDESIVDRLGNCNPRKIYVITKRDLETQEISEDNRMIHFRTQKEMIAFFRSHPNEYLPRIIVSKQKTKYESIIDQLHQERIHTERKGKQNIFLSICIPTYNRGFEALRAVERLLTLDYDSEIEIIVSNNGSDRDHEVYDKIKNLGDSRIRYERLPENRLYMGNITHVLEMAKGKYALIQSDDDLMITQHLHLLLNNMLNAKKLGIVICRGVGKNFPLYQTFGLYTDPIRNLIGALNQNYCTGMTFNMQHLRKMKAFDRITQFSENEMVRSYTHIYYLVAAVYHKNMLISEAILFEEGEEHENHFSTSLYHNVASNESRIIQCEAMIEMVQDFYHLRDNNLAYLLSDRIKRVYDMFQTSFIYYKEKYREDNIRWNDECNRIGPWTMRLVDRYKNQMGEENHKILRNEIKLLYVDYRAEGEE